jgi:C4-dicarboxylate transporter, DctQ subunit
VTAPDSERASAPVRRPGLPTRAVDAAAGLACGAIVVVVLLQVVGRLANSPVPWSEELTRALFIWMVFIGMASSMRAADAARVTVLLIYWPFARRLALPIYLAGCLGFFALMIWTGYGLVHQQVVMNESIATLAMPSWVIGIVMPLSAIIATVGTVASLRDHRRAISLESGARP